MESSAAATESFHWMALGLLDSMPCSRSKRALRESRLRSKESDSDRVVLLLKLSMVTFIVSTSWLPLNVSNPALSTAC